MCELPTRELCTTTLSGHYELFGAPIPGEVNGPRKWVNPKLSEALRPSVSARVAPDGLNRGTPLRSVLGFSEQVGGWVKKLVGTSENGGDGGEKRGAVKPLHPPGRGFSLPGELRRQEAGRPKSSSGYLIPWPSDPSTPEQIDVPSFLIGGTRGVVIAEGPLSLSPVRGLPQAYKQKPNKSL